MSATPSDVLRLRVLDVGEGDAILIVVVALDDKLSHVEQADRQIETSHFSSCAI